MSYIGVALQPDDWLGDEENNNGPTTAHQMDVTLFSTLEELDFAHDLGWPHTLISTLQRVCTTDRPEDQPEEDRTDNAECSKPLTDQRERKRSSNNWRIHLPCCSVMQPWRRSSRQHKESPQQGQKRLQNGNLWGSSQYSTKTKLRLYPSFVISSLLYSSECWRMTETDLNKLSTFHHDSMVTIIVWRRWRWIRHVMRREPGNISHTTLHWTPEGKRKQGRPENIWRQTVEGGAQNPPSHLGDSSQLALNRQEWGTFVAALHPSRHNGTVWVGDDGLSSIRLK